MSDPTFFEIRNIRKSFPGVMALSDVNISVDRGEVRALVGENGAGKSTLMKILNGNLRMDSGSIYIDGELVDITNPIKAAEYGISIIFQELNSVDNLSIAENIFAGRLSKNRKLINWKEIYIKASELLQQVGFNIDPKTEVGKLSVAGKQMVEIAKALSYNARIILMDEPSATLTKSELDSLFSIIRGLKAKGISVIYISHRLEEIFEVCDSVTVMRDGCIITTKKIGELTRDQIVVDMVGREINQAYPPRNHVIGEEILKVDNLRLLQGRHDISFSLHRGEVLGFAGLVGSGRTEIMRALYGVDYCDGGEVYVKGKKISNSSPKEIKKSGIAFLTEDRKVEGLVLDFSVKNNIVMSALNKICKWGFISKKLENEVADKYIRITSIKTPSREQTAESLSGGNQQKIVLSKWLFMDADIIIMDEPTRGIDVGAKYEIYQLINHLVEEGKGIIFISSEMAEVLNMSDRLLVMKEGAIVAELSGDDINAVTALKYAI